MHAATISLVLVLLLVLLPQQQIVAQFVKCLLNLKASSIQFFLQHLLLFCLRSLISCFSSSCCSCNMIFIYLLCFSKAADDNNDVVVVFKRHLILFFCVSVSCFSSAIQVVDSNILLLYKVNDVLLQQHAICCCYIEIDLEHQLGRHLFASLAQCRSNEWFVAAYIFFPLQLLS